MRHKRKRTHNSRPKRSFSQLTPRLLWIPLGVILFTSIAFALWFSYYGWREKAVEPLKVERSPIPPLPKAELPKVAIVIDDLGQDIRQFWRVLEIDAPVTVAILPFLPHSRKVAEEATSMGKEVILHLPMEPKDASNNPGRGALSTSMTGEEVEAQLKKDLEAIPYIRGVNNHMGSRFTEDEGRMKVVLEVIKGRGLYFLDSKTTPHSTVSRLAKSMGVRAIDRQVFLDNEEDREYVKGQVERLITIAKDKGHAVAIGHPHPSTLSALKEMLPLLKEAGVEVVPLSSLVH